MSRPHVAAFTDTYLPTINGVSYTVNTWRKHWQRDGGRMDVVYPASSHPPKAGEHPVESLPVPFYDGFRCGVPRVPETVGDVDLVHAHTPFGLGVAGLWLASREDVPLVVSYHTPTPEYAGYLAGSTPVRSAVCHVATRYEHWFLNHADRIIVPTKRTADRFGERIAPARIEVISNGVDTELFAPDLAGATSLRAQYGIPADQLVVGYTGRHGYEKDLGVAIEAVAGLDREVTLVLAGDGPAKAALEQQAQSAGVSAVFPGFLDRESLPALYSMFDVFCFPSPVETQGVVALEAIACGTPVVGAHAGALPETIDEGETGYTAPPGDTVAFRATLERALDEREQLTANCLEMRQGLDVCRSIDALEEVYASVGGEW